MRLLPFGEESEQRRRAFCREPRARDLERFGRGGLDEDELHAHVVGEDRARRHAHALGLGVAPLDDARVQRLVRRRLLGPAALVRVRVRVSY